MERPSDLIRAAGQAIGSLYTEQSPPITLTQLSVLRALTMHGPLNQTQLVEKTGIDRSTMATMLATMADYGHVMKRREGQDKRSNTISMTSAGRRAFGRASSALNVAERRMLRTIPPRHLDSFLEGLVALSAVAR